MTFIIPFVIWTILHWIIPRFYITFCTPDNFYGYLQSLFLTTSPHCNLLRNSLILSSYNINYLQISLAYFILDILHNKLNVQKVKVQKEYIRFSYITYINAIIYYILILLYILYIHVFTNFFSILKWKNGNWTFLKMSKIDL